MASTLVEFLHCATGGLDELTETLGSPTAQSAVKYSGEYAYKLTSSATTPAFLKSFSPISAAGDTRTYVLKIRFSDLSPSASYAFCSGTNISISDSSWYLALEPNGDLRVNDDTATAGTIAAPFTVDTWHTIRIDVVYHTTAGSLRVQVDGSGSEWTGLDTLNTTAQSRFDIRGSGVSGNGDVFVDCWAVWDTTEWKPTDIPDDIAVGNSHLTGHTTATDLGDALDSGTWDNAGELPFSDTNSVALTGTPLSSGTDTDDGSNSGVSGDTYTPAIGTILGAEVGARAKRGSGGGSTHTIYGGSSADTWSGGLQTITPSIGSSAAYYSLLLDNATKAPTTSEYFRFGFGVSGKQDITVYDMVGVLLYEPASTGGWGGKVGGVSSPAKVGGVEPGSVGGV